MKTLTDQEVLDLVLKADGNIDGNKVNAKYLGEHPELQEFLLERYDDIPEELYSNAEVIYRMVNHIDVRPTCVFCGELVPFKGKTIGYSSHCSYACLQEHARAKQERKRNPFKDTEINDETVLSLLSTKSGKFITDPKVLNKNQDLIKYLNERYDDIPEDKFSYAEVLYRIKNHIDTRPVCKTCGGPVRYADQKIGFKNHCSNQCIAKDKDCLKKIAESCKRVSLEKYGVENPFQAEEVKAKMRETWKKKYGVDNPNKSSEVRKKIEKTNLERYGYAFAIQNKEIKEKIKQKNLKNLGVEWPTKSKECREKMKKTNIEKYGHECVLVNESIKAKAFVSKKARCKLGKSKEEDLMFEILKELYPDTIHHYMSEKYPHACDFYIPSLELWIEYQGYGTHYGRLFRETFQDNKDLETIREKAKYSKFYKEVLYVWPGLDVKKYNDTITNNINFLSIYPKWSENWTKYYGHTEQEEYKNFRNLAIEELKALISQFSIETPRQVIVGETIRH